MGELLSGGEGQFRGQGMGTPGATGPVGDAHGVSSVSDALDGDLDAYLDRELFVGPTVGGDTPRAPAVAEVSGSMRALLDLAEEESEWLETLPPASGTAAPRPEPEAPAVVIPEWMRASPGVRETTPFAAMLSPVDPNSVHAGDGMGTDATGLPTTPWSTPTTSAAQSGMGAPMAHGSLLPGVMTPPPVMPVPGAPLPPWAPQHAVPMAPYPQQWGMPVVAPPEAKGIFGMRPRAFLGAVAVGTLAAGLLMVAGLHFHERVSGAPLVGQGALASGTAMAQGQTWGSQGSVAQASGTEGLLGAQSGSANTRSSSVVQAGDIPGEAGTQVGFLDTLLSSGMSNAAQAGTPGPVVARAGYIDALLSSGLGGAVQAGGAPGAVGVLLPGTGTLAQDGVAVASASDTSAVQQAAASVAQTVLSTAQEDVQAAANGLRAAQPTAEPISAPVVGGTTLTSGSPALARRESAPRKASAKTVPTSAAADVSEDTDTEASASEVAFNEGESDEESAAPASAESEDAESGAEVAAQDARPPNAYSELDEDFARELGFTEDAEQKQADPGATRTVYIPPAPDAKEHLTPDDVKAVVVTNQPAITACIRQHAKGTPVEGGGRFMVRWSVLPSGDTSNVAMDTDTLKATPLARCIEDVVRRWKFPAHQVRMEAPIRFPFVF